MGSGILTLLLINPNTPLPFTALYATCYELSIQFDRPHNNVLMRVLVYLLFLLSFLAVYCIQFVLADHVV